MSHANVIVPRPSLHPASGQAVVRLNAVMRRHAVFGKNGGEGSDALTGRWPEEDKRRALEARGDHHLTKPVEPRSARRRDPLSLTFQGGTRVVLVQ